MNKSEIVEINRFLSAKQLCSYAGLIPSTYSFSNTIFHGHISKQGSRWLRWILAEAMGHCIAWTWHLQQFYWRLGGRKGWKIAKVATERKLLGWIYHMLKELYPFQEMERIINT
ncbi:transposase [Chloroflexota bacterium]